MIRRVTTVALTTVLALTLLGAGGCREESEAMKKANLGRAYSERGSDDKAIRILQEAVSLDPSLAMSHELLAQAYEAKGLYAEAIDHYKQTIERDPVRDEAYARLGCLMVSALGPSDEAQGYLSRAIGINRTHSVAHGCMGAIHLDRREFPRAIASSELSVSLNPQNVQAHLNLAIAYGETGMVEEAKHEIRKTIALGADNPDLISRARTFLDALEHPTVDGGPAGPADHT